MSMSDLWVASDELLVGDPIAAQKIQTPYETPNLEAEGIKLGDVDDDDANEAAAALVLATFDDDDVAGDEPGETDDDDEIDDHDDDENVASDV